MKIRIEQLENRVCDKDRQPLDAVFFMPNGAISTDGRSLLVNPYMQGYEPSPDAETIAVLSDDCDKLAKFFKKRLQKGEQIDMTTDGDSVVFQCGELLTTATITIPKADRKAPDFTKMLDLKTKPIDKYNADRICEAVTAVSKASGCDSVMFGFNDGVMEITPIDSAHESRALVICVK
jgi:hypothetical protein